MAEPLLRVVKKQNFRLELLFVQCNACLGVFNEILDAFTDVYWAFKTAGADVKASGQYAPKIVKHSPERDLYYKACKLACDVKPYFEMHRSNWRAEFLLHLKVVRRCKCVQQCDC
jgi:hypothetical protein